MFCFGGVKQKIWSFFLGGGEVGREFAGVECVWVKTGGNFGFVELLW